MKLQFLLSTVHWDCGHIEHSVTACFYCDYKLNGVVLTISWLASATTLHYIVVLSTLFDGKDP